MDAKRIFLAIEIPPEVGVEIDKICQQLKSSGFALRFTPAENLHLTLVFLPKVVGNELPKISEKTKLISHQFAPFSLITGGLGAFPNLKLPRTVFVSLGGETGICQNLAKKIQKELGGLGFKQDLEKFVPHLTIARTKSYVNKVERRKLGETIQRWGRLKPLEILVNSIAIFESRPTSAGHIHTLLEKINLGK